MYSFFSLLCTAFLYSITGIFYVFTILIVYLEKKNNAQLEENWLGFLKTRLKTRVLDAVLKGMVSGLIISIVIVVLGLYIEYQALLMLWAAAFLLMLFNYRYISFQYPAAFICILSLLFKWPEVNVPNLLVIAGLLIIAESILTRLYGYKDSIAVWEHEGDFKPYGVYILNHVWPIPLIILTIPTAAMEIVSISVNLPEWWPIIKNNVANTTLVMVPYAALQSFSSHSSSHIPLVCVKEYSYWTAVTGIIVLILSIMAYHLILFQYVVPVIIVSSRELIYYYVQHGKGNKKKSFTPPWRGLRVLDIFDEMPGCIMGLRQGDIILSINGIDLNSLKMYENIMERSFPYIWIDIKRGNEEVTLEYKDYINKITDLGILCIPKQTGKFFTELNSLGVFERIINRFKSKTF